MLSLRTLLRHPLQFALMTLGIALGVAVMVSIDLANASAARAFDLGASAVTGQATHHIVAGDAGFSEALYVSLRTSSHWRSRLQAAPLVRAQVRAFNQPLTLLGIDPFAEAPFRSYLGQASVSWQNFAPLLTSPGAVLLSESLAGRYGLTPCAPSQQTDACRLQIFVNGLPRQAFLAGLLQPGDEFSRQALETVILTDISTAQSLISQGGILTQIDLILPPNLPPAELAADLPPGVRLIASAARTRQVTEMTAAFQVNLTALSLLALVVGIFLIYNTMTFSVVQRRPIFGTLRSLGYTRAQVFGMVLTEAALVGALGTGLGLGLGAWMGQGAVQMVTQTINDLFFVLTVRGVSLPPLSLLKGVLAGMFSSLLAAALPAWEAASVPPRLALSRAGLESKAQSAVRLAAMLGGLLALAGAGILAFPTRSLVVSFGGTFAVLLGLAALTPFVTVGLMQSLAPLLERTLGLMGRLAPRNVIRAQSRTAIAVAALMVAVSVTIGVQVMIASFRSTVTLWLEQTLQGDLYISAQGLSAARLDTPLPPAALQVALAYPQAHSSALVRVTSVESDFGEVDLLAVSPQPMDARLFLSAVGSPQAVARQMEEGAILLSEPLAARLGIDRPGGSLRLLTPSGWVPFPIAAIYADYASTAGSLRLNLDVYRRLWGDEQVNGVALFLTPGSSPSLAAADLRLQLSDLPHLQINPSAALRQNALEVFDRTFAITTAMQLVTTLVAFIGVLSSLLALQLEKAREMGTLRALGLTLAEMRRLTLLETGLLGAAAGLLALPTGYILAWILIFIINQRSFGWTLQMQAEVLPFAQAFGLAVGAALLAALYPAWRMNRQQPAQALRGE